MNSDSTTIPPTARRIVGPVTAPDHTTVYLSAPSRMLGIWAHPDDEAYLSAGLMDRIVRAGGSVTIVALSDGEAGFGVDDPRSIGVRRTLRRSELRSAMAEVGAHDVRFVGLPDGGVSEADPAEIIAILAGIVAEIRPEVTVTFGPDGITGHADHVACWRLATEAWRREAPGELWYAAKTETWLDEWRHLHDRIGMWMAEEPAGATEADVRSSVRLDTVELRRKRMVLDAHASQTAGVVAVFGEEDYGRWIAEESFRLPTATELAEAGQRRAVAWRAVA